jgi:hypothetical protein
MGAKPSLSLIACPIDRSILQEEGAGDRRADGLPTAQTLRAEGAEAGPIPSPPASCPGSPAAAMTCGGVPALWSCSVRLVRSLAIVENDSRDSFAPRSEPLPPGACGPRAPPHEPTWSVRTRLSRPRRRPCIFPLGDCGVSFRRMGSTGGRTDGAPPEGFRFALGLGKPPERGTRPGRLWGCPGYGRHPPAAGR